jgi:hypothetical protein
VDTGITVWSAKFPAAAAPPLPLKRALAVVAAVDGSLPTRCLTTPFSTGWHCEARSRLTLSLLTIVGD